MDFYFSSPIHSIELWRILSQFVEAFPGQSYVLNEAFYDIMYYDGFIMYRISNHRDSTITICQPGEIF